MAALTTQSDSKETLEQKLKSFAGRINELSPENVHQLLHETHAQKLELELHIAELSEAQHKLEMALENYTDLFDFAPMGYFILDNEGIIKNVNHTGVKHLGGEIQLELINIPFSNFLDNTHSTYDFLHHLNLAVKTNQPERCDLIIMKKDGTTFDALLEIILNKDKQGGADYFSIGLTNISEIKIHERVVESALRKEKSLNEMKSRFISLASHEFRTPLASILSSLYLIEKYVAIGDDSKRLLHSKKIKNAVNGLNEILNDFISLNQMENAITRHNPANFNIVTFIEKLLADLRSDNIKQELIYVHNGENQNVFTDKNLLRICLNNIIGNAIKYSPNGGKVEVETNIDQASQALTISVKDEGIGIPEEAKGHIFDQFYRAKNADDIQGTGLGLDITKKLVGILGGKIGFTSKLGEGTTFYITIIPKPQNIPSQSDKNHQT